MNVERGASEKWTSGVISADGCGNCVAAGFARETWISKGGTAIKTSAKARLNYTFVYRASLRRTLNLESKPRQTPK